jgi:hypothetical protein
MFTGIDVFGKLWCVKVLFGQQMLLYGDCRIWLNFPCVRK